MMTLHINWVGGWDAEEGPTGSCRCLGTCRPDELPGAIRRAWYDATRHGWGPGIVVVCDRNGDRVDA